MYSRWCRRVPPAEAISTLVRHEREFPHGGRRQTLVDRENEFTHDFKRIQTLVRRAARPCPPHLLTVSQLREFSGTKQYDFALFMSGSRYEVDAWPGMQRLHLSSNVATWPETMLGQEPERALAGFGVASQCVHEVSSPSR